jgi:hypothetical protein
MMVIKKSENRHWLKKKNHKQTKKKTKQQNKTKKPTKMIYAFRDFFTLNPVAHCSDYLIDLITPNIILGLCTYLFFLVPLRVWTHCWGGCFAAELGERLQSTRAHGAERKAELVLLLDGWTAL